MTRSSWIGVAIAAVLASACATPGRVAIPASLEPPATEALALEVAAKGVQVYQCRTKATGGTEWAFVAPNADLLDKKGRPLGKHGAGPFWEASDGSRIVGAVKARADAPVANAIPWLLLTTHSTGPAGTFGNVTSVQRVDTRGGLAPVTGCDAEHVGDYAWIPYTATYRLYAPQRAQWLPQGQREATGG